jgi:hypothetical protein
MSATLQWVRMDVSSNMDFADYDPCGHIERGEVVGVQKVLVVSDFYVTGGAPPAEVYCEKCGVNRERAEEQNDAEWEERLAQQDSDDCEDWDDDD